jgi:aryl-alcohol dehydrogenase-like predicted oxidoreductase
MRQPSLTARTCEQYSLDSLKRLVRQTKVVVDLLSQIARRKNATPAQIALAWLLAQKPWIVPIPGTTKIHRLEENIASDSVELTSDDLDEIDAAASKIPIQGERLPESILRMSYR